MIKKDDDDCSEKSELVTYLAYFAETDSSSQKLDTRTERGLVFVSNLKREILNIFNPTEQLCGALKCGQEDWFRINELFNLKDGHRTQVHIALRQRPAWWDVSIDFGANRRLAQS